MRSDLRNKGLGRMQGPEKQPAEWGDSLTQTTRRLALPHLQIHWEQKTGTMSQGTSWGESQGQQREFPVLRTSNLALSYQRAMQKRYSAATQCQGGRPLHRNRVICFVLFSGFCLRVHVLAEEQTDRQ